MQGDVVDARYDAGGSAGHSGAPPDEMRRRSSASDEPRPSRQLGEHDRYGRPVRRCTASYLGLSAAAALDRKAASSRRTCTSAAQA